MVKIKSDIKIHLGSNMKKLRTEKGLTQADVIRLLQLQGLDVSKQSYSHYEKEEEHIPASVLVALCEILDTTLDEIFISK